MNRILRTKVEAIIALDLSRWNTLCLLNKLSNFSSDKRSLPAANYLKASCHRMGVFLANYILSSCRLFFKSSVIYYPFLTRMSYHRHRSMSGLKVQYSGEFLFRHVYLVVSQCMGICVFESCIAFCIISILAVESNEVAFMFIVTPSSYSQCTS